MRVASTRSNVQGLVWCWLIEYISGAAQTAQFPGDKVCGHMKQEQIEQGSKTKITEKVAFDAFTRKKDDQEYAADCGIADSLDDG